MEYRGVHYIHPEWQMMDQFFMDIVAPALDLDSLTTSHPVSVEVKDPKVTPNKLMNIFYSPAIIISTYISTDMSTGVLNMTFSRSLL